MKDKNGKEIKREISVIVPEPNNTDIHQHSFVGYVSGFRNGYVTVADSEDNSFEIEPERLEIDVESIN